MTGLVLFPLGEPKYHNELEAEIAQASYDANQEYNGLQKRESNPLADKLSPAVKQQINELRK